MTAIERVEKLIAEYDRPHVGVFSRQEVADLREVVALAKQSSDTHCDRDFHGLRAEVAELRRRIRLARASLWGQGVSESTFDLLDLRKPLKAGR